MQSGARYGQQHRAALALHRRETARMNSKPWAGCRRDSSRADLLLAIPYPAGSVAQSACTSGAPAYARARGRPRRRRATRPAAGTDARATLERVLSFMVLSPDLQIYQNPTAGSLLGLFRLWPSHNLTDHHPVSSCAAHLRSRLSLPTRRDTGKRPLPL